MSYKTCCRSLHRSLLSLFFSCLYSKSDVLSKAAVQSQGGLNGFPADPWPHFLSTRLKQGPNPSLALRRLLSVSLDKFLLSGKPFRFVSHSSHAEIRAKSQAPSPNMCGSDGRGTQQGSISVCSLTRPKLICCFLLFTHPSLVQLCH